MFHLRDICRLGLHIATNASASLGWNNRSLPRPHHPMGRRECFVSVSVLQRKPWKLFALRGEQVRASSRRNGPSALPPIATCAWHKNSD